MSILDLLFSPPPPKDYTPLAPGARHFVSGRALYPPFPAQTQCAIFGLGCFWGAERLFWQAGPGVHVTAVGYAGGSAPNPTYRDVCTGRTGHAEVVLVAFDPEILPFAQLLQLFWEGHDPTQGMRQGNDVGPQYRSVIFATTPGQYEEALASREAYGRALAEHGLGAITTQISLAPPFYYAETEHQQYLAKNPAGYCGLGGAGVACPVTTGGAPPDETLP